MDLDTPVIALGKTYKINAKKLEKLGITTIEDLLLHIPSRYEDFSLISPIELLQVEEIATIKGQVINTKYIVTKYRKKIQKITVEDTTGNIECIWFNQPFILRNIKKGDFVSIAGKVSLFQNKKSIIVHEYEVLKDNNGDLIHTGRFVPIYPQTYGLSSKWIRNRIKELIFNNDFKMDEYLPGEITTNNNLMSFQDAIKIVHFPKNIKQAETAKYRLAFDELFQIQLTACIRRKKWEEKRVIKPFQIDNFKTEIQKFIKDLPFELTNAQKKAINEIFNDLKKTKPMNRLLEGDVGSGKTVVAAISMYVNYLNGFQSTIMAPTEILANQHYNTIVKLLSPLGIKVDLVTGSNQTEIKNQELGIKNKKKNHKSLIINHKSDILVGTHALVHEKIKFDKLGLVVIDEQQRFGVEQRSILREKGDNPHFLTMTATPIPRTVFLTMYGDLDLSYLDEMPKGRKKVKTWYVPKVKREAAYEWIKKNINQKEKNQVFIICPLIEESENMVTVKSAIKEYEKLKNTVFKNYHVGLLHGKLKSKDKQKVLEDFRIGKYDILVATPVVEVGIDIPDATVILIEAAERFGLAQLHQLRGRVGRNDKESYCLLFTESETPSTVRRLKYLETEYFGARLAEIDLKLRGPGEMFGTLQHGATKLKVASFSDFDLINLTKSEASKILLDTNNYPSILNKISHRTEEKISPD